MKLRITLSMDPDVAKKAKRIAHVRRTNVSALVESLVLQIPASMSTANESFVEQWAGKFRVRDSDDTDPKLNYLKKRYGLGK